MEQQFVTYLVEVISFPGMTVIGIPDTPVYPNFRVLRLGRAAQKLTLLRLPCRGREAATLEWL